MYYVNGIHAVADTLYSSVEIQQIFSHPGDSPDLGPPPVAHFDAEDPIKFDPPKQVASGETPVSQVDQQDDVEPSENTNFETRRRRRDSSRIEIRRIPVFESPPTKREEQGSRILNDSDRPRVGAKRKLSASEEEDVAKQTVKLTADDFKFSRRPSSKNEANAVDSGTQAKSEISKRKILGTSKFISALMLHAILTFSPRICQHISKKASEVNFAGIQTQREGQRRCTRTKNRADLEQATKTVAVSIDRFTKTADNSQRGTD
jgi:hypothetical protein